MENNAKRSATKSVSEFEKETRVFFLFFFFDKVNRVQSGQLNQAYFIDSAVKHCSSFDSTVEPR